MEKINENNWQYRSTLPSRMPYGFYQLSVLQQWWFCLDGVLRNKTEK
jgi:hypothetical protein